MKVLVKRIRNVLRYAKSFSVPAALQILWQKLLGRPTYVISMRGLPHKVEFRVGTDDLTVLDQIFADHELNIPLHDKPTRIIDGGGNVGYSALYFHRRFPDCEIFSVEPEQSNVDLFRRNCGMYPEIRLLQGAIWPRAVGLRIENPEARKDGFIVSESSLASSVGVVPGYSIPDILQKSGWDRVDILKLDIEGSELELFQGDVAAWVDKIGTIMVELHDRFKPGCRDSVEQALKPYSSKIIQHGEYEVFYLK